MGVIAGSKIPNGHLSTDEPSLVIAQATGRIAHANEQGVIFLQNLRRGGIGSDIRSILPIDLPPPSGVVEGTHYSPGLDGQWMNQTILKLRNKTVQYELTWKPVQFGWISYWIVTVQESVKQHEVNYDSKLPDSVNPMVEPNFKLTSVPWSTLNKWQLMSFHRPVGKKGGDVLFIEEISPDYILYFLGDVAGHHQGAEIVRLMLTSYLKMFRDEFKEDDVDKFPGMLLKRMNRALCEDKHNDSLLTGIVLILEKNGSRVWFASAGHQPVFLVKPDTERISLSTPDIPLGIKAGAKYRTVQIDIAPNDRILCYTDGLISSSPQIAHSLGIKNLLKTLEDNRESSPEDLAGKLQNLWRTAGSNDYGIGTDVTFTVIFQAPQISEGFDHPVFFH